MGWLASLGTRAGGATLDVPSGFPTINAAVTAALDGDTIRVAPGTYNENVLIQGKEVNLISNFATSGDPADIDNTIIDGGSGANVVRIHSDAGSEATILGFTLRNASDGISASGPLTFMHGRIWDTSDGIDFEGGSSGTVLDSVFEQNSDDALDLDSDSSLLAERNVIANNGDDGIEIRLHDYVGPTLDIVIRDNLIIGNGEDGIQLIDDDMLSSRSFLIEGNIIGYNDDAGIGMMCCMDTTEDFQGAPIAEPVHLLNNTIVGNSHGLVGGINVTAVNNLFVDNTVLGVKKTEGSSVVAYSLFWGNGNDIDQSNVDLGTTIFDDPLLSPSPDFELMMGSPAIDSGTDYFEVGGVAVLDLDPSQFFGAAPDVGAVESVPAPSADFNMDGVVDSIDLGILLGNFGTVGTPGTGELNGTPPVDNLDLGVLLSVYGQPSPSATAVPEPSTLRLFSMVALSVLVCRGR